MQDNMLFAGTAVANGSCLGIVNAIGMSTEVGKIQQQITEAAAEEEDTPLKKKLDVFGERLAQVLSRPQADLQVLQELSARYRLSCEQHRLAMRILTSSQPVPLLWHACGTCYCQVAALSSLFLHGHGHLLTPPELWRSQLRTPA